MESTASWHKFRGLLLWSWQQSSVVFIKNKLGCWDSLFPETTIRSAWGCPQQKEPLFWLVIFVSDRQSRQIIDHTNIPLCRCSQPTVPVCSHSLCSKQKLEVKHHISCCAQYEMQGQLLSDLLYCHESAILGLQKGYSYVALVYTEFSQSSGSARGEGSVVTAWVELLISCPKR